MKLPTYTIKPLYLGEMTSYEKSMHTFTFDYGVKMHSPYLAYPSLITTNIFQLPPDQYHYLEGTINGYAAAVNTNHQTESET